MSGFDTDKLIIVYDGECPFCRNYVRLVELKKTVGAIELVNARENHPAVRGLAGQGYDLNEGMAALYGGKVYFGSDAVTLISSLSEKHGIMNRMLAALLRNPRRAKFLYPYLKMGRNAALKLLGRPMIDMKSLRGD